MYIILLKLDGTIQCQGRYQDGTEYWTESDLKSARKSMKQFAKAVNNQKIKKRDICLCREEKYEAIRIVAWNPGEE